MYKMQFAASILIQYYVESGFWSVDMDRTGRTLLVTCSPAAPPAAGCSALGADTAVCCRQTEDPGQINKEVVP